MIEIITLLVVVYIAYRLEKQTKVVIPEERPAPPMSTGLPPERAE